MKHISPRLSRRAALVGTAQALAVLAAACTPLPPATAPVAPATPTAPAPPPTADLVCAARLPAVTRPTPIPYPGYVGVEPSTGLHVTAPPQVIELADYRLAVTGKVGRELSLTYDEIRCLPRIDREVTIQCPGFFTDTSRLAGAALAGVLALVQPLDGAQRVEFRGIDGRTDSVLLDSVPGSQYFLAYEWEGEPLPVSHGFPLRVALPGETGGSWVKWLQEIVLA